MELISVSLIPAVRVSKNVKVAACVCSRMDGMCEVVAIWQTNEEQLARFPIKEGEILRESYDLSGFSGEIILSFRIMDGDGNIAAKEDKLFEVVDTGVDSTRLLDGCWVDIYHWSESEGKPFNKALAVMTDEDWHEQIYAMSRAGIRGAVIQDVFHLDEYVGKHSLTAENYNGSAFYPSKLYSGRCPIKAKDPIEAILTAADLFDVHVAVGIGLFAWFDFTAESLRWHKRIAAEVYSMYGHHKSFYGFYVSEEVAGSLYFEDFHPATRPEQWLEIRDFFKEFKGFCASLAPTKPILFACNNIGFEKYPEPWKEILQYVDILLVFAFARDMDHLNVREVKAICQAAGTHFFVDLEVFKFPFDQTGLVPKNIDELISEIRIYDDAEQIYGYEYTGHLNHPQGPEGLGGLPAKDLYQRYLTYQARIRGKERS